MRVPDRSFHNAALRSLTTKREKYLTSQEQAMAGTRVLRASDDPVASTRARNLHTERRQSDDHVKAIDYAMTFLERTDSTMSEVNTILQRSRELAVHGLNDTLDADDREALSHEISAMSDQLATLANTKVGGRYIFSGYADDTPALDAAGVYQGTSEVPEVEIGPGLRVPLGVAGDQIFTAGANVIDTIRALRDALQNNDTEAMGAALDQVIDAELSLTDHWGRVGAYEERASMARSVAESRKVHAEEAINDQLGIDPVESYSNLTRAQGALQAAVQIAAQLPLPGLAQR